MQIGQRDAQRGGLQDRGVDDPNLEVKGVKRPSERPTSWKGQDRDT